MKKLELKMMENLQGGQSAKYKVDQEAPGGSGGAGYCTKETVGLLLGVGGLAFAVATGGLGAVVIAGAGLYLTTDPVAGGSCSSW